MTQTSPTPLLVLGMHRSGTSAMAGALMRLSGAEPDGLIQANAFNERGYFEPRRIVNLNDRLLASVGQGWDSLHANPVDAMTALQRDSAMDMIKAEVAAVFGKSGAVIIKDPRINRLLDLWLPALQSLTGKTPRALIMLRPPAAVAASLFARDRMQRDRAMLLYLRNLLDIERGTRAVPRLVVEYDSLLQAPVEALGKVVAFAPELQGGEEALADAASLLEPTLMHHADVSAGLPESVPHLYAKRIHSAIQSLGRGEALTPATRTALQDLAGDLDAGSGLFADLLRRAESFAKAQEDRASRQTATLTKNDDGSGEHAQAARTIALLADLNSRIKRLQSSLDELEARNARLETELDRAAQDIADRDDAIRSADAFIGELRERLVHAAQQEQRSLHRIGELKAGLPSVAIRS